MRVCCWGCWLLLGIFCQFGGFGSIVCVAPRSLRGSVEKRFLCVFCSELESADGFSDRYAVFFCEVCGWDLVSVRDGGFDVELLFGGQPENGLHVLLGGSHALLHHRGEFRFSGDLCLIGGVEAVELRMELRGDVCDVLQRDGEVGEGCQIESSFSLRLRVSDGFPEFLDACGGLDDLVLPVDSEIDFEIYVFGHDEI